MEASLNPVSVRAWRDSWLLPVLDGAGLLEPGDIARLRATGAATAWEACVAAGIAANEVIERTVAKRFRLPVADVEAAAAAEAEDLLPGAIAVRLRVVPLGLDGTALQLACSDPTDLELEQDAAFGSGRRVRLQVAAPSAIARALVRLYPAAAVHLAAVNAPVAPAPPVCADRAAAPAPRPCAAPAPRSCAAPAPRSCAAPAPRSYAEFDAFVAALLAECTDDSEGPLPPLPRAAREAVDAWARRIPRAYPPPADSSPPQAPSPLPDWL